MKEPKLPTQAHKSKIDFLSAIALHPIHLEPLLTRNTRR